MGGCENIDGSLRTFAQACLQLCEGVFDRVDVGL
jgi:hypothetical protein